MGQPILWRVSSLTVATRGKEWAVFAVCGTCYSTGKPVWHSQAGRLKGAGGISDMPGVQFWARFTVINPANRVCGAVATAPLPD